MIYVICGPTASGKTSAAIKLAHILKCPIINADAYQIYKEMNIGTAKLDCNSEEYKIHHLLDIKSPSENFSVKEYQDLFRLKVKELSSIYKNIIVCGGTGLYIKAALYDYVFEEEEPVDLTKYEGMTNEELFNLLLEKDAKSAQNLHQNNRKRVIRALAISENSSINKSQRIEQQEHRLLYEAKIFMLNPDREELYSRINERVEEMFDQGLVKEVIDLNAKYNLSSTARQAIGYKEVLSYLNKEIDLDECVELIKKRTRNYAKRQVTFFKNQFDLEMYKTPEELLGGFTNEQNL